MSEAPKLDGCEVLPPLESTDTRNLTSCREPEIKPKTTRKRAANRFATLNQFIDETLATLCRGDIAVWMILYRDTRNGTARTSQADIARRGGLSVRGAAKAIKRLEKRGLLRVVYQGGLNRGSSRYSVLPLPDT
ncbi:MAG: helix-turn-helix domain-containing protein [Lacipirellulaceae bacterium]